jgi:hypothetical protein
VERLTTFVVIVPRWSDGTDAFPEPHVASGGADVLDARGRIASAAASSSFIFDWRLTTIIVSP